MIGDYGIVGYRVGDVSFGEDQLSATGIINTTLSLQPDHTGRLILMGQEYLIEWTNDGDLTVYGVPYYRIACVDAETVELNIGDAVLTMKLGVVPVMPEATEEPSEPEATEEPGSGEDAEAPFPGAPYGKSDGVIDRAKLAGLYRWLSDLPSGFRYALTFDEIGEAAGKRGRDNGDNDGKTHSANWCDDEDDSITVTFREKDGAWTCSAIAIKGISSDEYGAADVFGFPKLGSSAPAGTHPTAPVTIDAKVGFSGKKVAVTAEIPNANWFPEERSGSVRIWCAPNAEKADSSQSYIIVECKESLDKIDFYKSSFENLAELEPRTIAGTEMQGRTYRYVGMDWIEYYGEIAEGVWVSIRLTGVDFSEGTETEAIVMSLTFSAQ